MVEIKEAIRSAIKLYMKHKEEIPEPINIKDFKGKIAYRTESKRHYLIAKLAQEKQKSISKTLDDLVDVGIQSVYRPTLPRHLWVIVCRKYSKYSEFSLKSDVFS